MTTTVPRGRAMTGGMPWWLFLVTGAAWLILSWFVLGFDSTSVTSIAALAGVIVLLAAAHELFLAFTSPGWKWLHLLLGALFAVTGVVILANPGRSFVWLSAFIGWYLLFKGIADIVLAFATKAENDAWWLLLIVGIVEILLGFLGGRPVRPLGVSVDRLRRGDRAGPRHRGRRDGVPGTETGWLRRAGHAATRTRRSRPRPQESHCRTAPTRHSVSGTREGRWSKVV